MNNTNYNTEMENRSINSKLIISDPSYQRQIDHNRVKRIVSNFNQNLVNPVKVSKRDGRYYVFDGQHTLSALKLKNNGNDLMVECKVYHGLTKEDEAKLFSEQNGISSSVEANARMKALLVAGDVEITEFYESVMNCGVRMDFTKGAAKNKIVACNSVYKIFKKTTRSEFSSILTIIKDAWGGEAESFRKEIIEGVTIFYMEYKNDCDINRLTTQLSKTSPIVIIREGNIYKEGGSKRYAQQILNIYNKGMRSGKLQERL